MRFKRAKYRSDVITQFDDVHHAKFFAQSVDNNALEQLQFTLSNLEQRFNTAKKLQETITQEEAAINDEREALLQQRNSLQGHHNNRRLLESRLNQRRQQLANLEADKVDMQEEEEKVKKECAVRCSISKLLHICLVLERAIFNRPAWLPLPFLELRQKFDIASK